MAMKILIGVLQIFNLFSATQSYNGDFTITYGVSLNLERFVYFDNIQPELCMKECTKRLNCSSINFDRTSLQCNLSMFDHTDGIDEFITDRNIIYASINSRSLKCATCLPYESCLFLSSGSSVCIATECSNARPEVFEVLEYSFDPPFLRFTNSQANYTTSSTCVPGKPWLSNNAICASPQSIITYGNVTMSSIFPWDGRLEQYRLDSPYSWSAFSNTENEWIQLELPSTYNVTEVLTKGRGDYNQWVTSYYLMYLNESSATWNQLSNVFTGNSDSHTVVTNTLEGGIFARGIRLKPKTWYGHISLRFDVHGCSLNQLGR